MTASFLPQDEIIDRHVNQNDLSSDTYTKEDADITYDNLPTAPDVASDEEAEEKIAEINPKKETQTFTDAYVPEVVAPRTAVKRNTSLGTQRQIIAQCRHAPLEIY